MTVLFIYIFFSFLCGCNAFIGTRVQGKDTTSHVVVLAPVDTDVTGFGSDFVRVQGLATTLKGPEGDERAVHLIGRDATYGSIMACPPMHSGSRKLTDAGPCGANGQRICVGAELDGAHSGSMRRVILLYFLYLISENYTQQIFICSIYRQQELTMPLMYA